MCSFHLKKCHIGCNQWSHMSRVSLFCCDVRNHLLTTLDHRRSILRVRGEISVRCEACFRHKSINYSIVGNIVDLDVSKKKCVRELRKILGSSIRVMQRDRRKNLSFLAAITLKLQKKKIETIRVTRKMKERRKMKSKVKSKIDYLKFSRGAQRSYANELSKGEENIYIQIFFFSVISSFSVFSPNFMCLRCGHRLLPSDFSHPKS